MGRVEDGFEVEGGEESSAALGDDAKPVVFEGAEAVGAPLDEFHFAMEALGDAVGAREPPHARDLLGPVGEGPGEGDSGLQPAVAQSADEPEQLGDVAAAGLFGLALQAQQSPELFLEFVDRLQDRMGLEEAKQPGTSGRIEPVAPSAQDTEPSAIPAERRAQLPGKFEQMLSDQPDGVESVGDDDGAREPAPDECAVAVGQIDANHAHPLAPTQARQIRPELGFAATGAQVENPVVLEVAKGRREALAPMQRRADP